MCYMRKSFSKCLSPVPRRKVPSSQTFTIIVTLNLSLFLTQANLSLERREGGHPFHYYIAAMKGRNSQRVLTRPKSHERENFDYSQAPYLAAFILSLHSTSMYLFFLWSLHSLFFSILFLQYVQYVRTRMCSGGCHRVQHHCGENEYRQTQENM